MKYLLSLLLCLSPLVLAFGDRDYNQGYDPKRNPLDDYQAAIAAAKAEHKLVLLEFGGDWCVWCHRLDKFVSANADLHQALVQTFVAVKVNVSPDNGNEAFLARFPQVPGYPHFMVVDPNTLAISQQGTGKFEQDKSYSKARIMEFVARWRETLGAAN